ncbi:MAG: glycosyltransferase [Verrucomicrobiota bacterium]
MTFALFSFHSVLFFCSFVWRLEGGGGGLIGRGVRVIVSLGRVLWGMGRMEVCLVQAPPAVPVLMVARVVTWLRGARLVVDWHNIGWTILGMKRGEGSLAVRFYRGQERFWGRRGDGHMCVSDAMRERLGREFGLEGVVVCRDRVTSCQLSVAGGMTREEALEWMGFEGEGEGVLIGVSPTSWTVDENFGILLEGLPELERVCGEAGKRLVLALSGEGPGRERFEKVVGELSLERVRVRVWTGWVPASEYRGFLMAADFGMCFHASSSGDDVPMKLFDLLGAGLPVAAYDYGAAIREGMSAEEGCFFSDAGGLVAGVRVFLDDGEREALRKRVAGRERVTWEAEWEERAKCLLGGRA